MNYTKPTLTQENTRVLGVTIGLIMLSLVTWLLAFNSAYAATAGRLQYANMTVAEVLEADPEFSTLAAVLPGTMLENKLMTGENVTVFAPSNEAFAKLSTDEIEALLMDPMYLDQVLNLHWVDGRIYTGYFYNERFFMPDGSTEIPVRNVYTDTYIGNAKLVTTDISTRNGIIHIINEVIMPGEYEVKISRNQVMPTAVKPRPEAEYSENIEEIFADANDGQADWNVMETLGQYDDLSVVHDLIIDAGLASVLAESATDMTIFAPTNKAFSLLDNNEFLSLKQDPLALMELLLDHVIPEKVTEDDMSRFVDTSVSLNDSLLRFSRVNSPMVENARIIVANLESTNGVIHVIDRVIDLGQ